MAEPNILAAGIDGETSLKSEFFRAELRAFVYETRALVKQAECGHCLATVCLKDIMNRAEDLRLVSRAGMAHGIKLALREDWMLASGQPVEPRYALPVLRHIHNQARRANNILTRGGHVARSKGLYSRFVDMSDWRPLFR